MKKNLLPRLSLLLLAPALLLAACGKLEEKVTEKALEKIIQTQMEKDGSKANVELSSGATKITSTDAQGQTTVMELDGAKVDAADIGVPFYPGAVVLEKGNQRIQTPEGSTTSVTLQTKDTVAQISDFYRGKLRARSEGKSLVESVTDKDAMLLLGATNENSLSINVQAGDDNIQKITLLSWTMKK